MYRCRLAAGQFGHALGCTPCRSRKKRFQPELFKHGQDSPNRGRLSRSGAAGDHNKLVLKGHLKSIALQRCIGDPLLLFDPCDQGRKIHSQSILLFRHFGNPFGSKPLGLIELGKIAGPAPGYLLKNDTSVRNHGFDYRVDPIRLDTDQLASNICQLFPGNKTVSASGIVFQFENNGRCNSVLAVKLNAHFKRHVVGFGKASADVGGRQEIGIFTQDRDRAVAVISIEPDRQNRAEIKRTDILHQPPHSALAPEGL